MCVTGYFLFYSEYDAPDPVQVWHLCFWKDWKLYSNCFHFLFSHSSLFWFPRNYPFVELDLPLWSIEAIYDFIGCWDKVEIEIHFLRYPNESPLQSSIHHHHPNGELFCSTSTISTIIAIRGSRESRGFLFEGLVVQEATLAYFQVYILICLWLGHESNNIYDLKSFSLYFWWF